MLDFVLVLALLFIPFLIHHIDTQRKGLITGLFLSLFFWGKISPVLPLVPFSCALFLFRQKRPALPQKARFRPMNPALPMFLFFLLSMVVFCALSLSFYSYGSYVGIDTHTLRLGEQWGNLALLIGPVWIGNRCDRRGPFHSAILLTLAAELSVWIAAAGSAHPFLFIAGAFCVHLCISGFFALMPVITAVFLGESAFYRAYPLLASLAAGMWIAVRLLYVNRLADACQPGNFLISLLFFAVLSAAAVSFSWKRRFVLLAGSAPENVLQQRRP